MLTFLRKIRKSLFTSGTTSSPAGKYLLYAFGEILLVMIGILLALQVNNWNERQKQKQVEIKLIKELAVEMKQNMNLLQQSLSIHNSHDSISNSILYNWKNLKDKEKINSINDARWFWTTDLLSGTLKSIISEHGLTIISDDSLRQFIASWEDQRNDFYENEELDAHLVHDQLYPLMSEFVSFKLIDSIANLKPKEKQIMIVDSKVTEQVSSLVSSKKFENLLIQRDHNRYWCIREIEHLVDELNWAVLHAERVINQ